MFTQECFLRNASKLIWVELEALGYSPEYMNFRNNLEGSNVICEHQRWHFTDSDNTSNVIDCGINKSLFFALAALNDNTDKNQWFVCNEDPDFWIMCLQNEFHCIRINPDNIMQHIDCADQFHKATPCEIVEHFKRGDVL